MHQKTVEQELKLPTFSVFVSKLECLNQSHDLINRTADWQVIDGDLAQNSFVIDYEQTSEIHTSTATL